MLTRRFPLFYLEADGGAGAGASAASTTTGGEGSNAAAGGDSGNTGGASGSSTTKTFTQEDLDRVISDRLARERKTWEKTLEDEKKKAQMDEAERAKVEKQEALDKASQATTAANQRVLKAEARILLNSAGVKPERLDAALRVLDLSSIEFNESGEFETKALSTAIEGFKKDFPEFLGQSTGSKGGGEFNGSGGASGTVTEKQVKEWEADSQAFKEHYSEILAFYQAKKGR